MSRQKINRVIFYAAGLLILALGIILNTKAGLYTVFVVLEMFMHTIKNMYDRRHGDRSACGSAGLYGNRRGHVVEYADCSKSWRRNCTGDCRLYSSERWKYKEWF